jgi:hypothetical protein
MATTTLATPVVYDEPVKAMTIAPDSAAVAKDRQADPAINAALDRGNLCLLRVALGSPVLEDVGRQLPTNVAVRDPLTQAPVSAITLPRVTAPADMLALNHSLVRLLFL